MISILLHYPNAQRDIDAWESLSPDNKFSYPLISLDNALPDHYHLLVEPIDLDNLEVQIGLLGGVITYIGCFNQDGTLYIWEAPNDGRNYDINKYTNSLADIVTFDSNGVEIARHRPTVLEAKDIQVNKISGWKDRIL